MSKHFNEIHEAIIYASFVPIGSTEGIDDGTIIPHQKHVGTVKFYETTQDQYTGAVNTREIILTRKFIVDLADHITQIESETKDLACDSLPF